MKLATLLIASFAAASIAPFAAKAGADTMAGISAESCSAESCRLPPIERDANEAAASGRKSALTNADNIPVLFSLSLRRNGLGRIEVSLTEFVSRNARVGADTCIAFNAAAAKLRLVRGDWTIVDGRHRIKGFGNKPRDAQDALDLIRIAQADQLCLGGRLSVVAATARR